MSRISLTLTARQAQAIALALGMAAPMARGKLRAAMLAAHVRVANAVRGRG